MSDTHRAAILRIIPARAGFTRPGWWRWAWTGDHPRSRGVYGSGSAHQMMAGGSSPLARGLPRPLVLVGAPDRIIPARAGFTGDAAREQPGRSDHPRSRGVYDASASHSSLRAGSSPLARGLPRRRHDQWPRRRIIPARAGFTRPRRSGPRRRRDHPRSRGVYVRLPGHVGSSQGSSPLARGLPGRIGDPPPGGRIIPARAGFTGP